MAEFINELRVTRIDRKLRRYRLDAPFTVRKTGHRGTSVMRDLVVVPSGFLTDGASVPSWLWGAIPPDGMSFKAAVVHDWLCLLIDQGRPHPGFVTRRRCDDFFLELLEESRVPAIQRWAMYLAVRWFSDRL
ncbi:MAG: DUF1353 domain-containing protein [Devosia sp.]|uniref:DUF1353 domain-containing protein n=1 Tax=Devosia sp. 66-22 TaxID=1895753 RepID=UPI0009276914|nr:DUF1353 domain-containing protein [Devosia sp. 66-22]MBN9346627.1 DUF1353 domain-containing protein [Devosia sp.]OJX54715.1 MAG: hypothetical protein BGO81_16480 [Devosia sp. 66-22]